MRVATFQSTGIHQIMSRTSPESWRFKPTYRLYGCFPRLDGSAFQVQIAHINRTMAFAGARLDPILRKDQIFWLLAAQGLAHQFQLFCTNRSAWFTYV